MTMIPNPQTDAAQGECQGQTRRQIESLPANDGSNAKSGIE